MKCNYQFSSIPESGVIVLTEGALLRLFFDIVESPKAPAMGDAEDADGVAEESETQTYDCIQVDVASGRTYADIVSAIINDRYSNDDVQAILANYTEARNDDSGFSEEKTEEYMAEYSEYQQWRKHAKEVAAIVLEQINQ